MAYEYFIDTAVNCVFICHTGDYAIGEGMRAMIQATKKPEYQRGMNFLRDMQQTNFPSEADFANLIFTRTENVDLKEAETNIGTAKLAWLIGDREDYILAHQVCVSSRVEEAKNEAFVCRKCSFHIRRDDVRLYNVAIAIKHLDCHQEDAHRIDPKAFENLRGRF